MRLRVVLWICCLWLGTTLAQHDSSVCILTEQNTGVPPPDAPSSYWLSLLTLDQINKVTMDTWEYFDGASNKAAMLYTTDSVRYQIILDYNNKQSIVTDLNKLDSYDNCQVNDITSITEGKFMARVNVSGTQILVPSNAFFFAKSVRKVNREDTTERGIPVRWYYSCYYWAEENASVEINWFYKLGALSPFVITMKGKYNTNNQLINSRYEISRFRNGLRDDLTRQDFQNALVPQLGVFCPNMKFGASQMLDSLRQRFSIEVEKEDPDTKVPYYLKEAYDFKANLSFMIYDPQYISPSDSAKYASGILLTVYDYSRGMAYIRNQRLNNCTYEAIPTSFWDNSKTTDKARLRYPEEFFDFFPGTLKYQFKGQKQFRGVNTDVFIAARSDYPKNRPLDSVFEWYFVNRTAYDYEGNLIYQRIPAGLYFGQKYGLKSTKLNIYNYNDSMDAFSMFDVALCFPNHPTQHVQMDFSGEEADIMFIETNRESFIESYVTYFASAAQVSVLRLYNTQVYIDKKALTFSVEVTIAERSPSQPPIAKEPTLATVVNTVQNQVSTKQFLVQVTEGDLENNFEARNFRIIQQRTTNSMSTSGLGVGAVVGVAIGMLVLGLIIGMGIIFAVYKSRGNSLSGIAVFQRFT